MSPKCRMLRNYYRHLFIFAVFKCQYAVKLTGVINDAITCTFAVVLPFLADRTNGRAYATVLRLSVRLSVCL